MAKPPGAVHLETTLPSMASARTVASRLLEQRLVACVWFLPLESEYWWQGKLESGHEILLVAKTTATREKAALKAIEALHPYEVPYIASNKLGGVPKAYLAWLSTAGEA